MTSWPRWAIISRGSSESVHAANYLAWLDRENGQVENAVTNVQGLAVQSTAALHHFIKKIGKGQNLLQGSSG